MKKLISAIGIIFITSLLCGSFAVKLHKLALDTTESQDTANAYLGDLTEHQKEIMQALHKPFFGSTDEVVKQASVNLNERMAKEKEKEKGN
jgi:hypothetical protein